MTSIAKIARLEIEIARLFPMAQRGGVHLLVEKSHADYDGYCDIANALTRWELVGARALTTLEVTEAQLRLTPEGFAFISPVYLLSATWLAKYGFELEALGDMFIPPLGPDWYALRALIGEPSSRSAPIGILQDETLYNEFFSFFTREQREFLSTWLAFYSSELYPEYFAASSFEKITRYWSGGLDA